MKRNQKCYNESRLSINKVLLTGANGFIGVHLKEYLKKNGHEVISISHNDLQCLNNAEQMECYCHNNNDIDAIVHLSANIDFNDNNALIINDNVTLTYITLLLSQKLGVKKYIYTSSTGIYGQPVYNPIDEQHPIKCLSLYHQSKFLAEELIRYFYEKNNDFNYTIMRISSPLGYGLNRKTLITQFIENAIKGSDLILYGAGSRVQNYIDIRDICTAIKAALECKKSDIYNLVSGKSYSNREIAEICLKIFNSKSCLKYQGADEHDDEKWIYNSNKIQYELGWNSKGL